MKTRLYTHPICSEHLNAPGHPERPERLRAIAEALAGAEFAALERVEAPAADPQSYTLAHPQAYVDAVAALIPEKGLARIDGDTAASPKSWEAVARAVGGAIDAVDAVMTGAADNAFVAVRSEEHTSELQSPT